MGSLAHFRFEDSRPRGVFFATTHVTGLIQLINNGFLLQTIDVILIIERLFDEFKVKIRGDRRGVWNEKIGKNNMAD